MTHLNDSYDFYSPYFILFLLNCLLPILFLIFSNRKVKYALTLKKIKFTICINCMSVLTKIHGKGTGKNRFYDGVNENLCKSGSNENPLFIVWIYTLPATYTFIYTFPSFVTLHTL